MRQAHSYWDGDSDVSFPRARLPRARNPGSLAFTADTPPVEALRRSQSPGFLPSVEMTTRGLDKITILFRRTHILPSLTYPSTAPHPSFRPKGEIPERGHALTCELCGSRGPSTGFLARQPCADDNLSRARETRLPSHAEADAGVGLCRRIEIYAGVLRAYVDVAERRLERTRLVHRMRSRSGIEPRDRAAA